MIPKWAFLITILIAGCNENKGTVAPPENFGCKDLTWLNSIETSIANNNAKGEIYLYKYKSQNAFEIKDCLNCPDMMTIVKNCEGVVICQFGGIGGVNTCPDFYSSATSKTLVWKN